MSEHDSRERFSLYRLCECPTCAGTGKEYGEGGVGSPLRCPDCRGEGRIRQEVASCGTPEAVGVALVTLGREGEWSECAFGLLDRMPPCEHDTLDQSAFGGHHPYTPAERALGYGTPNDPRCPICKGTGVKPTGTWIVLPWLPSARNVRDAARTLARSKRSSV